MANNPPSQVLLLSQQVQLVNLSGFWEVAEPSRNWYTKFWLFWISAARLGMKNYAEVINCNINRIDYNSKHHRINPQMHTYDCIPN
ncbi:MAG: hypothetical protein EAZ88_25545 [Oscillatoriales cyanobacterium]|nr:MAG: hypothetical protein EAZ88_25545 [Oscillatoriales cyanobacterium]